ncbi:MAG: thermonuclease family protein [Elusimicrobiota bacterium]
MGEPDSINAREEHGTYAFSRGGLLICQNNQGCSGVRAAQPPGRTSPRRRATCRSCSGLNREAIRAGYAWWYRHYSDDESLGELEKEAREARRGLWAQDNPEAPWAYRRRRREKEVFDDPMEDVGGAAPVSQ